MTKKKKFIIAIGVLLAVALVVGFTTLATTNYGSSSDPLVTLSYLNTTVTPSIKDSVTSSLNSTKSKLEADIDTKISEYKSDLSSISSGTSGAESFTVVSLSNGQTLSCSVGTEIMLRIGTAVSAGPNSPRLIDETTGSDVTSAGSSLVKNHMYMVTIKDNGIKATSSVKVLVRGTYTIS